jgi:hypothetical protein
VSALNTQTYDSTRPLSLADTCARIPTIRASGTPEATKQHGQTLRCVE